MHGAAWTEPRRTGLVSTMTLAQLREAEYGAWHDSWRPDGSHGDTSLLTLDALVSRWFRPVKVFVGPSITSIRLMVENKLLALLHRFRYRTRLRRSIRAVVMSFSAAAVWRIRRAAPLLPTVFAQGKTPIPDQQCGHGVGQPWDPPACVKGISAAR